MSILDLYKAYQTPISLLMVVFGPQILRKALNYINNRNRPSASSRSSTSQYQTLSGRLKVFLTLHTLYHLSHLLIPPFDLFSTPDLPILAPNDILRSRLHPSTGSSNAVQNPLVDLLLVRLQNLDSRLLYLRYGHTAVQGCLWCRSPLDFLLASLPGIMSRYLLAALVMVALGNEVMSGKGAGWRGQRWNSAAMWALGLGCIGEIGVRYFWDLRISNGDTFHVSPFSTMSLVFSLVLHVECWSIFNVSRIDRFSSPTISIISARPS